MPLPDRTNVLRARRLCAEMRDLIVETQQTLTTTRLILERCGDSARSGAATAAGSSDGLCRLFDCLMEACARADDEGDAETIALIERAILHVGGRIERRLDTLPASTVQ